MRTVSEIDLIGWPASESSDGPDLVIRRSKLDGPAVEGPQHSARWLVDQTGFRLAVQGVGRYRVVDPGVLEVDPEPGASAADVTLYLTGAALSAVLHLRGSFPLHASAVAIDGTAVAIAGPSGAGKSTLVATLVSRGAGFLTDDVCVVSELEEGRYGVWPGAARAKLDDLALTTLESRSEGLDLAGGTRGKYHLPFDPPTGEPVHLGGVYLLTDGPAPVRVEPLSGLDAVSTLLKETYFVQYAGALGVAERCFRLAGAVARTVQVAQLVRPRALERVPELAAAIESEIRGRASRGS